MIVWETLRFVLVDIIIQILYFPVWWYTEGTLKIVRSVVTQVQALGRSLGLKILFQFLLKPMYGQADIAGRIISFFVRIVHFFVLLLWAIVYTVVLTSFLFFWLLFPLLVAYSIVFHLGFLPDNLRFV
jgi:hypothetical protein